MACDTSTGACLPYSCNYGYYLDTTCKVATGVATANAIMQNSNTSGGFTRMGNCVGFNRLQTEGDETCASGISTCNFLFLKTIR